jgi:NAD(P)-dependent dehydrogenase (short-subunit alcohol dehydrogenase family)
MRWDDVHWRHGYDKWAAYGQAKTANVLFAVHLDRLARDRGVRAFALHPGGILTPLQRHLSREEMIDRGWIDERGTVLNPERFKTPQQGAATQVWAATSPQLDGLGGLYLEDCDVAEPAREGDQSSGVKAWAVDAGEAARLWALSAELTGVDAFGS